MKFFSEPSCHICGTFFRRKFYLLLWNFCEIYCVTISVLRLCEVMRYNANREIQLPPLVISFPFVVKIPGFKPNLVPPVGVNRPVASAKAPPQERSRFWQQSGAQWLHSYRSKTIQLQASVDFIPRLRDEQLFMLAKEHWEIINQCHVWNPLSFNSKGVISNTNIKPSTKFKPPLICKCGYYCEEIHSSCMGHTEQINIWKKILSHHNNDIGQGAGVFLNSQGF